MVLGCLAKNHPPDFTVIPAKAGIQPFQTFLDSRLRGNDAETFAKTLHKFNPKLPSKLFRNPLPVLVHQEAVAHGSGQGPFLKAASKLQTFFTPPNPFCNSSATHPPFWSAKKW
jgi:hypothetical protein